jgi:3',5'-cyclic AMP phosphodiesterase CpdA
MRRITRRQALGEALAGAGALAIAGCGGSSGAPTGSTLHSSWWDPDGTGQLRVGPGEPLIDRTELAPRSAPGAVLASLAHVTDAHVLDASSPARVTFLDRLGPPFQSTFRPQEALTVQVLAGAVAAIRAARPDVVIQGGDLIDNAQLNELHHALSVLGGGRVTLGSGPHGYFGVQSAFNPDPFYYRPDLDAPQHPGLLAAATRAMHGPGLTLPTYPVLGDHDALVAGEMVPTPTTRALAVGDRALWELPPGLALPPGVRAQALTSPDGPPAAGLVNGFLHHALAGPTVSVPPDPRRREMSFPEVIGRLRATSSRTAAATSTERLDYVIDVGAHLRVIVLDLVRREGGSGGLVAPDQPAWLRAALAGAAGRWVIVISHQPLITSEGGEAMMALLDSWPTVVAAVSGHTHRNRITPRPGARGGYWLITTASLIDYPQQARMLRLRATRDGVALQTWMLDHADPGHLGPIARDLAYLDAQGGRPNGFAGTRQDRNVALYRRRVA